MDMPLLVPPLQSHQLWSDSPSGQMEQDASSWTESVSQVCRCFHVKSLWDTGSLSPEALCPRSELRADPSLQEGELRLFSSARSGALVSATWLAGLQGSLVWRWRRKAQRGKNRGRC